MGTKKNIFLTGAPSSGKTTVIKKVVGRLTFPANGFYTEEEKENGKRAGFLMVNLEGEKGYLAHQNIKSNFRIRRYGVSIKNIEQIAVSSIAPKAGNLIIIDEIGKMECFSLKFKEAALLALNSKNIVLGTITFGSRGFIQEVKERPDVEIIEVNSENRNRLPEALLRKISQIKK